MHQVYCSNEGILKYFFQRLWSAGAFNGVGRG